MRLVPAKQQTMVLIMHGMRFYFSLSLSRSELDCATDVRYRASIRCFPSKLLHLASAVPAILCKPNSTIFRNTFGQTTELTWSPTVIESAEGQSDSAVGIQGMFSDQLLVDLKVFDEG